MPTAFNGFPAAPERDPGVVVGEPRSPYGARRYWRFDVNATQSANAWVRAAEIMMFGSKRRAENYALNAFAITSGDNNSTGGPASVITDGDPNTFWASASSPPGVFVELDLVVSREVRVIGWTITDDSLIGGPADFTLSYSDDGVGWVQAWAETGITDWVAFQPKYFMSPHADVRAGATVIHHFKGVNYFVDNMCLGGNIIVNMLRDTANTVNIPAGLSGRNPVTVVQGGIGPTSFVAEAGVTIKSLNGLQSIAGQYGSVRIIPLGGDEYYLVGALK